MLKKKFYWLLLIALPFFVSATTPKGSTIEWLSFEEAVKRNQQEPRLFIIDVYTDWCGWCKKMDATTFSNPIISEYINQHYYAVKFDAEQKQDLNFDGHTFKYVEQGKRGYHEFAVALTNGKLSYPTVVFLTGELKMIQPVPGFQQPQNLDPILRYFVEGMPKQISWEDFQANHYQSPF